MSIRIWDVETHGVANVVGDAKPVSGEFTCVREFAQRVMEVYWLVKAELQEGRYVLQYRGDL
jgi:hypothetical protein